MIQPIRQLQIPNLINQDILEDVIFTEDINVIIQYEFDEVVMDMLCLEVSGKLPPTFRHITISNTPLDIIKSKLESRIVDSIENNTFKLIKNSITIDGLIVKIDCSLKVIPKYS